MPSAFCFNTSAPEHPPPRTTQTPTRILVLCLCKASTEEMTSLRKLVVSFTHGQESCQCLSQADNMFFSQLALQLSVKLQKVTKEEIGLAVVLVTPRTPRTFDSISCLWPGFLIGTEVQSIGCEAKPHRGLRFSFIRHLEVLCASPGPGSALCIQGKAAFEFKFSLEITPDFNQTTAIC